MVNLLLKVSYDGSSYSGFQVQPGRLTIQGELERALQVVYKEPVTVHGSGRTDAGVHALEQAVSCCAPFAIDPGRLPYALNALTRGDLVVWEAREVQPGFHARFSARGKRYSYRVDRAPFPRPLRRGWCLHQPGRLNIEAMRAAAVRLEGEHDFAAFRAAGSEACSTVRSLYRVKIMVDRDDEMLEISYSGSGFLYRMARMLTGTLLRVGKEQLDPSCISGALKGVAHPAAGPTAPAHGLCLERVFY